MVERILVYEVLRVRGVIFIFFFYGCLEMTVESAGNIYRGFGSVGKNTFSKLVK